MADDEWLPALEVAKRLGIPTSTMYRWAREGRLESRKKGRWLVVKMPQPPPAPRPEPKPPAPKPPPPPPGDPNLLDVPAVAELLGVSGPFIHSLVRSGRLPAQRLGRFWFVHRDDLAAYIEACLIVPARSAKKRKVSRG